jgi:parallel beta-helix repeat protein
MFSQKDFASLFLTGAVFILSLWLVGCSSIAAQPAPTAANTPTPTPVPPKTYYVSLSGNDSNIGTELAPWRHIQFAIDQAKPGDIICVMKGVYNESIAFHNPGTTGGGFITLQSYPGQAPVIDGSGLPTAGQTGLVTIENMDYIKLIGFELRNLNGGGDKQSFPAGIWVRGHGGNIEIRNNRVHAIQNSCEECGAHGIAVYGTDAAASLHDITIDGNEVYDNKLGWSESLVLNGNVEKFSVSNNQVHDNDNIGIDLIGYEETASDPEVDRARDGSVTGNLVYNINSYGNPAYGKERSADGIYVDGGTNIIIDGNTIHNTNIGIELASEHAGKSTSKITVRNNFIYENTQVGIAFGGYDTERGSTEDCFIVNNTLFNNVTQGDWGAELYIQYDTRNNVVKNNIIYANQKHHFIESWSPEMTANQVDYNLYYADDGVKNTKWIWKKKTYNSFAAYQKASGNDTRSLIDLDPLFVSLHLHDLHLQKKSPAIDKGQTLPEAGKVDIDGWPRVLGKSIDIGADEVP